MYKSSLPRVPLHPHKHLVWSIISHRCIAVSHCGFHLHFPNNWEYFHKLFAICIGHLVKSLCKYFAYFNWFVCFLFFSFFGHSLRHAGSKFPDQGSNMCSLYWEHGVLTPWLPGKSPSCLFSYCWVLRALYILFIFYQIYFYKDIFLLCFLLHIVWL